MTISNPHARIDAENRGRDRRSAAALRAHPELAQIARDNLQRWLRADRQARHPALLEWEAILDFLVTDELAAFLEGRTPKAERLRQSSPFIGLEEEEPAALAP